MMIPRRFRRLWGICGSILEGLSGQISCLPSGYRVKRFSEHFRSLNLPFLVVPVRFVGFPLNDLRGTQWHLEAQSFAYPSEDGCFSFRRKSVCSAWVMPGASGSTTILRARSTRISVEVSGLRRSAVIPSSLSSLQDRQKACLSLE